MIKDNHLLEPIRCLLDSAVGKAHSEYEVIQVLQQQGWLEFPKTGDHLALYAVHFLVYNALYQLVPYYREQGYYLHISALAIELVAIEANLGAKAVVDSHLTNQSLSTDSQTELVELEAYYLDWANLEQATLESVEALLDGFWQRFVDPDDYQQALAVLAVEHTQSDTQIRQRYRRLAMEHHPDRGGDRAQFQAIQQAFATIRRYRG